MKSRTKYILALTFCIPFISTANTNQSNYDSDINQPNIQTNTNSNTNSQINSNSTLNSQDVNFQGDNDRLDNGQPSDTALTTKIKTAFFKEKLFGDASISAFTIKVETKNGIVHLTGTADSQIQADNAVKLTKGVAGVKDVISTVEIKAPTR